MTRVKSLKEKLTKIFEREGVVITWDKASGLGTISSGTKSYSVNPELVKSFGDERMPMKVREVTFEVGDVDGKEMVTSIALKGQ